MHFNMEMGALHEPYTQTRQIRSSRQLRIEKWELRIGPVAVASFGVAERNYSSMGQFKIFNFQYLLYCPERAGREKRRALFKTALLGGFLFQAQFAYLTYAPGRIFSLLLLRQKTEIADGMSRAANNLELFPRRRNGFKDA
jgi:hypothetical protein